MRLTSIVLGLATTVLSYGQPAPAPVAEPLTKSSGAFFALSVPNLRASVQWYSDKLGLKVSMQAPKTDGTAFAVLEGGGLIVELVEREDAMPLSKAAAGLTEHIRVHGPFKAGVVVDNWEKTLDLIRRRQIEIAFGPYPARPNQRANVIIKDNAGNLIQFFGNAAN